MSDFETNSVGTHLELLRAKKAIALVVKGILEHHDSEEMLANISRSLNGEYDKEIHEEQTKNKQCKDGNNVKSN